MKKLLTSKNKTLSQEEKKTKSNFIGQGKWFIQVGLFSQGQAFNIANDKESALAWVEKAQAFL